MLGYRKADDISAAFTSPPTTLEAGQIYSFQTRPYTEFSPPVTGRYASIKILGVSENYVVVAVQDGIWSAPPTLSEARTASIISEHRFAHTGRPAVFGSIREWWTPSSDLDEFNFVGMLPMMRMERSYFDAVVNHVPGSTTAGLYYANYAAEGEWRWSNDRENFLVEIEKRDAKNKAEREAKEERYRVRLSKLTWEKLRSETPFERWKPSPPFPPEEFTLAARATIRDACNELESLGPKPRKANVRAILKKTVFWFNEADENAGHVIETEEREDIYAVLEEIAHVAKQKCLVEEIDEWRDW